MTLTELEELTDVGNLYTEVDTTTIKQLIALCRMQNRALQNFYKHTRGVLIPQTRCQGSEALAAFEQFDKGEK